MKSAYVDEFKKHFAAVVQQKEEQKKEEFVPGEMVFAQHVNSPSAILPVKGTPKKLYPAIVREVVGELISIQWSSKEGDKKRKVSTTHSSFTPLGYLRKTSGPRPVQWEVV